MKKIKKIFYHIVLLFIIGGLFGYIFETIGYLVQNDKFINIDSHDGIYITNKLALNEGYKIVEYLKSKNLKDTYILGPSTSMIPKINNIFSVQILLKYKDTKQIYPYLKELKEKYQKDKILLDIDMSPIQMWYNKKGDKHEYRKHKTKRRS